jgi:hypothetical protein
MKKHDQVHYPAHYTRMQIEVIDLQKIVLSRLLVKMASCLTWSSCVIIQDDVFGMLGPICSYMNNILKYVYRAPYKGKHDEDLEKSVFFMERLVVESLALNIPVQLIIDCVVETIFKVADRQDYCEHTRATTMIKEIAHSIVCDIQ